MCNPIRTVQLSVEKEGFTGLGGRDLFVIIEDSLSFPVRLIPENSILWPL